MSTNIPYSPNVPQFATDSLAVTQSQFLNNFLQLYNIFGRDHVALDAQSNAGNHTYIELNEQTSPQQTNVSEIAVYTKNVPGQTDQIFLRYQGNGQEIQYTTYQIYSITATKTQTAFFTFLPGNVIAYFGYLTPENTTQPNLITLRPPVAKNIITVSCVSGNMNAIKPNVSIVENTNGIVMGINVAYNTSAGQVNSYYLILANI